MNNLIREVAARIPFSDWMRLKFTSRRISQLCGNRDIRSRYERIIDHFMDSIIALGLRLSHIFRSPEIGINWMIRHYREVESMLDRAVNFENKDLCLFVIEYTMNDTSPRVITELSNFQNKIWAKNRMRTIVGKLAKRVPKSRFLPMSQIPSGEFRVEFYCSNPHAKLDDFDDPLRLSICINPAISIRDIWDKYSVKHTSMLLNPKATRDDIIYVFGSGKELRAYDLYTQARSMTVDDYRDIKVILDDRMDFEVANRIRDNAIFSPELIDSLGSKSIRQIMEHGDVKYLMSLLGSDRDLIRIAYDANEGMASLFARLSREDALIVYALYPHPGIAQNKHITLEDLLPIMETPELIRLITYIK